MSRKKTVKIIYDAIKDPIKKLFRSNVVFCEAMGFTGRDSWVSDLKRGRNLPSPEEAARMCVLLQTTPEEILSEEADVELVRSLIEQERKKSVKKERPADSEALTPKDKALLTWFHSLHQEKREALLNLGDAPKELF